MRVWQYIARRILFLIPQLLGVSAIVFFSLRVLPGDPVNLIVGPIGNEETRAAVTEELGLDKPIHIQYGLFLRDIGKGNLGESWNTRNDVVEDLWIRLPATVELITLTAILGAALAILLGVFAAVHRHTMVDHIARLVALVGVSLPNFWLGLIFIFYLSVYAGWFPAPLGRIGIDVEPPRDITGLYILDSILTFNGSALKSSVWHMTLPVFSLVFLVMGPMIFITRSAVIESLTSDYVTYARASGLPKSRVRLYALRGALPPVITTAGIFYSVLIGAAVLTEVIFSWPGVAKYAVDSMLKTDYNPVQGFVLLAAVWTVVVFLIVDLFYVAVDPRITRQ